MFGPGAPYPSHRISFRIIHSPLFHLIFFRSTITLRILIMRVTYYNQFGFWIVGFTLALLRSFCEGQMPPATFNSNNATSLTESSSYNLNLPGKYFDTKYMVDKSCVIAIGRITDFGEDIINKPNEKFAHCFPAATVQITTTIKGDITYREPVKMYILIRHLEAMPSKSTSYVFFLSDSNRGRMHVNKMLPDKRTINNELFNLLKQKNVLNK